MFAGAAGTWLSLVLVVLSTIVVPMDRSLAAEPSPQDVVDIFFKTLEQQGRNPRVIHSGDVSYEERSVLAADSRAGDGKTNAQMISALEDLAKNASSDLERERWRNEIRDLRKEATDAAPTSGKSSEWIKRDVFVGNNPRRRSREEAVLKTPSNGLSSEQIRLCEYDGAARAFVSRFPEARSTSLTTNAFAVSSIEYCGRARSPMALALTTLLIANGGSHDAFTFSPATLASLKQTFEAAASTDGLGVDRIPHLVATDRFEGSDVVVIEFGMRESPNSVKMQTRLLSLTVDPNRGFIVPVEEEYHDGRRVIRLESSDYRQSSEDGLWFPWESKETHYDPATGEIVSERTWQVTAAVFNHPVGADAFEITIPAGEAINDSRASAVATTYRTAAPITIGAILPQGDLTSIAGITKPTVLTGRHLPDASSWPWGRRLWLVGTVAILAALVGMVVRKRRRPRR